MRSWLVVLWLLFALSPCQAQGLLGDAANGRELAARLCSTCHATGPDAAASPRLEIPSFRTIGNAASTSPERLAGAIIVPHPEMPNVPLTRAEIRDIIAYILSLKRDP